MEIPGKVLVVAYNFPPWGGGGAIRITKFVKYLLSLGWEVHVLTIKDSYIDPDAPLDKDFLAEVQGCHIHKTDSLEPKTATKGAIRKESGLKPDGTMARRVGLFGKSLAFLRKQLEPLILIPDYTILWAPYVISEGKKIARQEGIELVFANCPPYGNLVNAWLLARFANLKLVADIKDIWVESPFFKNLPSLRQAIDRWLERRIIRKASKTILVSQKAFDLYGGRYPADSEDFSYIPNGLDLEDFKDTQTFTETTFRIMVPGLLNNARNPMTVVKVLKDLIQQNHFDLPVEMVFVGEIHQDYIEAGQSELGEHLTSLPHVDHGKYIDLMKSSAGVVVISSRDIPSMVPGKLYEAMASQRPFLLLSGAGAAADLCKEHQCGTTASWDDSESIRTFIVDAYDKFKQGAVVQPRPEDALKEFSREHLTQKLSDLFTGVLKGQ